MTKKSATPPLPALSLQQAHELEAAEHKFYRAIENCIDGYGSITHELKAETYIRSYVVKFFSIYIDAYKNFAATNLPLWIPELKVKSIEWVIMALGNYRGVPTEKLREYFVILDETLDEYLKTFRSSPNPLLAALADSNPPAHPVPPPPLGVRERTAYAAAGVDVASQSPLLQMAMTQDGQQQPPKSETSKAPGVEVRQSLWDAYRQLFPGVSIIEVCWAAGQRRREWDRWLKGQKKDGSKPDRMFRSVLTSGKEAKLLRQETRPKEWK
jgi:hypothetical protein